MSHFLSFFENALLSILYGNTCNHFIYVLSLLDGTRLGDVQRRLIILPTLYLYLRTQLYKILYFLRKTYKDYYIAMSWTAVRLTLIFLPWIYFLISSFDYYFQFQLPLFYYIVEEDNETFSEKNRFVCAILQIFWLGKIKNVFSSLINGLVVAWYFHALNVVLKLLYFPFQITFMVACDFIIVLRCILCA